MASCTLATALHNGVALAQAQNTPPPATRPDVIRVTNPQVKTAPPAGFSDLDEAVSTEFDVLFQGRRVGSFAATYDKGRLVFTDPAAVVAALGPAVDAASVTSFLAQGLDGNEQFQCPPGRLPTEGCGLLPSGTSGAIVNINTFSVTLFLGREYLLSTVSAPQLLGPPTSTDFSLIQGARFSATSGGNRRTRYGGTFDTIASIGRSALVEQATISDDTGLRIQQFFGQRVWGERRAAAGLLQNVDTLTLTNYRVLGGEFGSFFGTLIDPDNDTATPIEILLPQRAQVEIYREGVLLKTATYAGGLQLLDTRSLPQGSYNVRIVARDGAQILLDQTRSFSKLGNLVPLGKLAFRVRVGERVADDFLLDGPGNSSGAIIPRSTGEFVISGMAQRRFGKSLAGGLNLTSFNSRVFGESTLQVFRGRVSGVAGVGGGSGGVYSLLLNGAAQFRPISFFVSARRTHVPGGIIGPRSAIDRYRPFLASQDSLFASAQTRLFGGAFSLSGGYTRSALAGDRYQAGLQFSRSVSVRHLGIALINANATRTDIDTRFGVSISFFRSIDRRTDASFTAGGQYIPSRRAGGGRRGFSPIGEATLTRYEQFGPVDVTAVAGASTDADSDRAFAQVRALSPYGSVDGTAQYQTRNGGSNNLNYQLNAQSGFVLSGGALKLGLRAPAESMILVDLSALRAAADQQSSSSGVTGQAARDSGAEPRKVAAGGYRITINSRPYDYVVPGRRVAIGVAPYREYKVGLQPEGAPQFDLSGIENSIVVYPGNVARARFQAQRVVSVYGQILDAGGAPLAKARIEAGSDFSIADDKGYFTVTAPLDGTLTIRKSGGGTCLTRPIRSLIDASQESLLYRFGKIRCDATSGSTAPDMQVDVSDASPAADDELRRVVAAAQTTLAASEHMTSPLGRMVAHELLAAGARKLADND